MNILCSTDNNYVQHCYIMLISLFDNNSSQEVDVYILVSNLSADNEKILKSISSNPLHKITLIEVDDKLEYCPIREGDHISKATYYRILAPVLLPQNIDKILYLDVDIIVCQDLAELYNTDIEDYAIGAVLDNSSYHLIENYDRLEYSPTLNYVNAGVLLINLYYWREHKVMEECLEFIATYPEKCKFHDQDAINYVLREQKKLLPLKYNFQIYFLIREIKVDPILEQELHKTITDRSFVIIHYTAIKPWVAGFSPYKEYYFKYKKLTPYANIPNTPKPQHPLGWRVKRWLYNICVFFGLKKPIKTYIVKDGKLDLD